MSIEELVIDIVSKVLEDEMVDINTSINNSPNWDSINHLKILVSIEGHFECQLSLEEIGRVNSVRDWVAVIENTATVS